MANNKFERISPGVYKDLKTGKTVKSPDGKMPEGGGAARQPRQPGEGGKEFAGRPNRNAVPLPRPTNKNIIDQNQGLAAQGGYTANELFDNSQFAGGQAFNPELQDRTITGNWGEDRRAIEDAVYGNLTRGLDDQYGRERMQLQDELVNSGNGPGTPRYEQQMQEFNRRYDDIRAGARGQATQFGGQELERGFGIQEGIIGNQLSQAESIRNQQLGEIGAVSQLGIPNMTALQGMQLERQKLNQAMKALGGGGGGGGGSAPQAPGPVFSPTPYGYG